MSGDLDRSDQVGPLLVEIDGDLDGPRLRLRVKLADMHPLEVDQWQLATEGLCELDGAIGHGVLGTLHREARNDESCGIVGQLLFGRVDLELHGELLERPAILLGNRLSSGREVRLWIEQASKPETTLAEVRLLRDLLELGNTLGEVADPSRG